MPKKKKGSDTSPCGCARMPRYATGRRRSAVQRITSTRARFHRALRTLRDLAVSIGTSGAINILRVG